jgi:hypothetical protein
VTHSGSFHLFGVDVKCHRLDDGRSIIEAESMERLFAAMAEPGREVDAAEMEAFARWQKGIGEPSC